MHSAQRATAAPAQAQAAACRPALPAGRGACLSNALLLCESTYSTVSLDRPCSRQAGGRLRGQGRPAAAIRSHQERHGTIARQPSTVDLTGAAASTGVAGRAAASVGCTAGQALRPPAPPAEPTGWGRRCAPPRLPPGVPACSPACLHSHARVGHQLHGAAQVAHRLRRAAADALDAGLGRALSVLEGAGAQHVHGGERPVTGGPWGAGGWSNGPRSPGRAAAISRPASRRRALRGKWAGLLCRPARAAALASWPSLTCSAAAAWSAGRWCCAPGAPGWPTAHTPGGSGGGGVAVWSRGAILGRWGRGHHRWGSRASKAVIMQTRPRMP